MQIAQEQQKAISEEMKNTCNIMAVDVSSIRSFAEQTANNISEMMDIQYKGLEQLEAINKNTANLFAIKDDIADLRKIAKDYWR